MIDYITDDRLDIPIGHALVLIKEEGMGDLSALCHGS